jgi:hypothetical protein
MSQIQELIPEAILSQKCHGDDYQRLWTCHKQNDKKIRINEQLHKVSIVEFTINVQNGQTILTEQ